MSDVHLRLMYPYGPSAPSEDAFNGVVELARVPVEDDMIDHEGETFRVRSVTFYTDGSAPYVVAR